MVLSREAANRSPLQQFDYQRAILDELLAEHHNDPAVVETLLYMHLLLDNTKYAVRQADQAYNTRYYCLLCYNEIPREERVEPRYARGSMHHVCLHIIDGVGSITVARRALQRGSYVHSAACFKHSHDNTCPILDEHRPLPTIGEKRSVFAEPR